MATVGGFKRNDRYIQSHQFQSKQGHFRPIPQPLVSSLNGKRFSSNYGISSYDGFESIEQTNLMNQNPSQSSINQSGKIQQSQTIEVVQSDPTSSTMIPLRTQSRYTSRQQTQLQPSTAKPPSHLNLHNQWSPSKRIQDYELKRKISTPLNQKHRDVVLADQTEFLYPNLMVTNTPTKLQTPPRNSSQIRRGTTIKNAVKLEQAPVSQSLACGASSLQINQQSASSYFPEVPSNHNLPPKFKRVLSGSQNSNNNGQQQIEWPKQQNLAISQISQRVSSNAAQVESKNTVTQINQKNVNRANNEFLKQSFKNKYAPTERVQTSEKNLQKSPGQGNGKPPVNSELSLRKIIGAAQMKSKSGAPQPSGTLTVMQQSNLWQHSSLAHQIGQLKMIDHHSKVERTSGRNLSYNNTSMPANNRLEIIKKEQYSRGGVQRTMESPAKSYINDSPSAIMSANYQGTNYSPIKIEQQNEDYMDKDYQGEVLLSNKLTQSRQYQTLSQSSVDKVPSGGPLPPTFPHNDTKNVSPTKKLKSDLVLGREQSKESFKSSFLLQSDLTGRKSIIESGQVSTPHKLIKGVLSSTITANVLQKSSLRPLSETVDIGCNSVEQIKNKALDVGGGSKPQINTTLRGKLNKQKRVVLAAGSSHFRHSSNSVKKALLAQAGSNQCIALTANSTHQRNSLTQGAPNSFLAQSSSIDKTGGAHKPLAEPFTCKVVPALAYESVKQHSTSTAISSDLQKQQPQNITKRLSGNKSRKQPFGHKFNVIVRSQQNGLNEEMKNIIEKEKQLTQEIIQNSLIKQNGKFNFEALANLNEIIESKKNLKKKLGVEGMGIGFKDGESMHGMFIKSYSETAHLVDDQNLNQNSIEEKSNSLPQNVLSKVTDPKNPHSLKNKRISDYLIKSQYGRLGSSIAATLFETSLCSPLNVQEETPPPQEQKTTQEYTRLLNVIKSKSTLSQDSIRTDTSVVPPPAPPQQQQQSQEEVVVQKKKKMRPKSPKEAPPRNQRVKIFHQEDFSKKHINDHPINKAIQKINYIIRLIFKYQNQGQIMPKEANFESMRSFAQNITLQNFQIMPGSQMQSCLQQHQSEEQRVNEIQRVVGKWFGLQIPVKKLGTGVALREFFQSREFTQSLRSKFNNLLNGAINKSNQVLELVTQIQAQQISSGIQFQRFYVGWGNNDAIVRQVLKQRHWWQQYNMEDFNEVSFMWTQWKKQNHIDFLGGGTVAVNSSQMSDNPKKPNNSVAHPKRQNTLEKGLKIYNRMEQNKQLTNKKGIFLNMREYYYMMKVDPFDVLPLTFLIKTGKGTGDTDFQRFQSFFNEVSNEIRINNKQRVIQSEMRSREIRHEIQKKNRELKLKALQLKKSQKNQKLNGKSKKTYDEESDISFNSEEEEEIYQQEQKAIENDQKIKDIQAKYPEQRNIWIVKPGENSNRGQGINVCSDINEIRSLVLYSQRADDSNPQDHTYIIQRYIDNPLLIHGRKFDFRCYGVMTSINGHLKGYFYEDGYIRTSCKEFDIEDVHNKFIHLTNDAVQKYSQDYGKYENGNKLSLSDLQKYLKATYPNMSIDVWRDLMPQIRKLVTDSFRSVYGKIDPSRLNNTFELFGYDFMLDQNFRLYLIEVNTNPCLEMSSPLLARIIPDVLENTFRIVLDPIFPPPDLNGNGNRKHALIPQEIKYTLVFDEDVDGPELKKLREESQNLNEGKKTGIDIIDEIESDEEDDEFLQRPCQSACQNLGSASVLSKITNQESKTSIRVGKQ